MLEIAKDGAPRIVCDECRRPIWNPHTAFYGFAANKSGAPHTGFIYHLHRIRCGGNFARANCNRIQYRPLPELIDFLAAL